MTPGTPIILSDNNIHTHAQRESVSGSTTLGGRGTIVKKFEPAGDPSVTQIYPVTTRVTLPHNDFRARECLRHNDFRSFGAFCFNIVWDGNATAVRRLRDAV